VVEVKVQESRVKVQESRVKVQESRVEVHRRAVKEQERFASLLVVHVVLKIALVYYITEQVCPQAQLK